MTYRIITTTDPHHASRALGFKLNDNRTEAHRLEAHSLTLEEARAELLRIVKSKTENCPQYWNCETLEETAKVENSISCCVRDWGAEASFNYDVYTYRIEEESGNYDTLITADDFSAKEAETELERIAKLGMEAYDEEGFRLVETWEVVNEWDEEREVSINGEWYTREGFIEATLIYKEI